MTVSAGIRGNAGILFTMKKVGDVTAAVEYDGDVKAVRITSEDRDDADLTFEEAAAGETKDYTLAVTAIQSTAVGSFWRLLWDNPGEEFDVVYGPHGNAVASTGQPHFGMTVKAAGKPEVGGEANRAKDRFPFDYELEVLSGPDLIEA